MTMHNHGGLVSNTEECFSTFIGCEVKGIMFGALPLSDLSISRHTRTIIFACGWGLTIHSNGSYWIDPPDDIGRAIKKKHAELDKTQKAIEGVLALMGQAP